MDLATHAPRRASDKLARQRRGGRAGGGGQQGIRLLEADIGVDADAEAAQRRPRHTPQLGQQPGQGVVAALPVRAHSLTAPWVRPSMMRRWKASTRSTRGTVTTVEAAATSPQGT